MAQYGPEALLARDPSTGVATVLLGATVQVTSPASGVTATVSGPNLTLTGPAGPATYRVTPAGGVQGDPITVQLRPLGAETATLVGGFLDPALSPGETQTSFVAAQETTTSTAFVNPTTPQAVSVVVPASGQVLLEIGSFLSNTGTGFTLVSVELSGANVQAAGPPLVVQAGGVSGFGVDAGRTFLLNGLAPGSTTFTMKVRALSGTATIGNRSLTVTTLA